MKFLTKDEHKLAFVLTMLSLTVPTVQAGENTDFQTWLPININLKLGEQLRGFFEIHPRFGDDTSHLTSMMIRPALGWAITPTISVWAGYLMSADDSRGADGKYLSRYGIENRVWQGLTYKDMTEDKSFIWEMRNRLEERFLSGKSDPSLRWRTRFRFEYIIPEFSSWSIIASEELFINLNDNSDDKQLQAGLNQNRAHMGIGYRFAPEFQIETGYLEQHTWRRTGKADTNNSVWVTNLNINF